MEACIVETFWLYIRNGLEAYRCGRVSLVNSWKYNYMFVLVCRYMYFEKRNLCGSFSIVSIASPSRSNVMGVALPDDRENDLHFDGLSLSCIDFVHM